MPASHVMLDCETLGTDPEQRPVVLSVAAVSFEAGRGVDRELHVSVDADSCQAHGLSVDEETLDWWGEQSRAARRVLDSGRPLPVALETLSGFLASVEYDGLWACGPSFDHAILAAAYRSLDRDPPWDHWAERDVRTLRALPCWVECEHRGVKHDALDDAKQQARSVAATLAVIHDLADGRAPAAELAADGGGSDG